jgi:hypothetical protein
VVFYQSFKWRPEFKKEAQEADVVEEQDLVNDIPF